ncbi:MAG: hypothetical protein IPP77_05120 [Bacteroidetes bacterium]|nr:hypothetical protein [Bacteroidota bacterium]
MINTRLSCEWTSLLIFKLHRSKIFFFFVSLLCLSSGLFAQVDTPSAASIKKAEYLPSPVARGRYIIGGAADLSNTFQKNNGKFNLSLAPSFGIFVFKGLAIGGRYSFAIGTFKTFDAVKNKNVTTTTFTSFVGPLLKYYYGKSQLKGLIAAQGGYSVYTALKGTDVSNYNGFAFGASVGMAHFFNPHLALETSLYFNTTGYEKQFPSTRVGISLGLFAFLNTKKQE